MRDPDEGLVPDGDVDRASLRTLVDLRRRYLPRGRATASTSSTRRSRTPRSCARDDVTSHPAGAPHIRLLQLTSFVSTLDRFAMPPMLVAIATDLDVPLSEIVHAAGAYFLVYGLMQPVWGAVSDRLGRVRTMRLTLLLAGLCSIGSAFALDVGGPRTDARAGRRILRGGLPRRP